MSASNARASTRFPLHLGVVTHVPHWDAGAAGVVAFEPYVREMRVWASLFERVTVCAPRADGAPPGSQAAYDTPNVAWRPVRYSLSYARGAPFVRLAQVPGLVAALARLVRQADVVLLRSPGHPALFARLVADALRRPHVTKWAGYFGAFDGERLPSRVERWLVTRGRAPVLVYGEHDAAHLVPFPPALMSAGEIARADALGAARRWEAPWHCMSVGRLLSVKNFDLALRGLASLRTAAPDVAWRYTLIGSGPEEPALRALATALGISDRVTFTGALPFADVQRAYAEAHVVIMPGVQEGWPKIVAEAWAHGAVPVAASAGLVPWIMGDAEAGALFDPTGEALGACLARLLREPHALPAMAARGRRLVDALSLEAFGARVVDLLHARLGL